MKRFAIAVAVAAVVVCSTFVPGRAQSVPPLPSGVTYILPSWSFSGLSDADFAAAVADLRARLGEGPLARVGFTTFIHVYMTDWNVDTTNPAAVRAALADTLGQIDSAMARAVTANVPICLSFVTATRSTPDAAKNASELEDRRNMEWYTDNTKADGWWSQSQYARKQRRVREAYIRELGKAVAAYMAQYPDILVAATGDGEVELSFDRWTSLSDPNPSWADYSPFATAEFRDWLRAGGLYAPGQPLAGKAYAQSARYAGDASPAADTNGDTHTLNGDFGTSFTSWDLRYLDWSLNDDPESDPKAIPSSTYSAPGWNPLPDAGATLFDPPRSIAPGNLWWETWNRFRQEMIWRTNVDFARWMTTSADPATGATIPSERWYSDQVPADYLFGNPPPDTGLRLATSASPWWTADVSPYGSLGITSYNSNDQRGNYYRTLVNVAPAVAARNVRWGVTEWNPSDPSTTDPTIYRQEMYVVEQYRPSLLIPFYWGDDHWQVQGSGFEVALREMIARIKDPPPAIVTQPASQAVVSGATVTFTADAAGSPSVQWQVSGNAGKTWNDLTEASPYSGVTQKTLTVTGVTGAFNGKQYRAAFTEGGTIYTDAATLTVYGPVSASPSALVFAGSKRRDTSVLSSVTPAQVITVDFEGASSGWTASVNQPWAKLTNASGTGAGQLSVSIDNTGNPIGTLPLLTATVTITPTRAGLSPTTVAITLGIDRTGVTGPPPFGQVDSPAQNQTGVVGAIGFSGWALDVMGVTSVKIYRDCLPFEPEANCQWVTPTPTATSGGPRHLAYIGDATFVAGARPDVEAHYSQSCLTNASPCPQAYRAGWGFLLLSNMLPDVTGAEPYGGQGPLNLHALAINVEGNTAFLGRTGDTHDPTSITMANAGIAKPFGAIDTPAQGQMVSGSYANFGWALTPDTDTAAGASDIFIPTTGGTMRVYVDGVSMGVVVYNQCRGDVGNPVPAGVYCDDDVSNIFGNPTPQPALAPHYRTSNPTKFRNLDERRAAIGAYVLDTTALTNGQHTIVWGVTDSQGRADGIGSRFFTVLNGGTSGDLLAAQASSRTAVRTGATLADLLDAPGLIRGDARSLAHLAPAAGPVWGRTGYQERPGYDEIPAGAAGVRRVQIPELGRLELSLGPVDAGYLVANGTLRDLPVGSHLDRATGLFTWMPGPAYLGTYRLTFVRGGEQVSVDVTVGRAVSLRPASRQAPSRTARPRIDRQPAIIR